MAMVLSLNWIHSKIISGATFCIIGLTKNPKIEFLPLDWMYRCIRTMTVLSDGGEWGGGGGGKERIAHVKKKWCGNETKKKWERGLLPSTSSEHAGEVERNLIPTDICL